jgi:hypothetical protein
MQALSAVHQEVAQFAARIEREAQAEPEPDVQAETAYEIELEL